MASRMTPLERRALRVFQRQLEREKESIRRVSEPRGFVAEDQLKSLIELHSSNIRTYEKLVADLKTRPDRGRPGAA
jgi:hypothetical protein